MIFVAQLAKVVRDPSGTVHMPHTQVTVISEYRELGTHRTLYKVCYGDTHSIGVVLPQDVEALS